MSQAATALAEAITAPDWQEVLESYSRCVRITRQLQETLVVRPEAFTLPAEKPCGPRIRRQQLRKMAPWPNSWRRCGTWYRLLRPSLSMC